MPGCVEVRLADAEADDLFHRADDVEEVADTGAGDVPDGAAEAVTE